MYSIFVYSSNTHRNTKFYTRKKNEEINSYIFPHLYLSYRRKVGTEHSSLYEPFSKFIINHNFEIICEN